MTKKGLEFLARIFGIVTSQVNGNYCAESKNKEFQVNLNQIQKVRCFTSVTRTISDKQQQSCLR